MTKTKADIQNEFTEVKNGKTLEFKNNNEVISDGILCSIGVSPVKNITCIYALESDKEDSTSGLIICSEQTDEYCYDEVYFMINEYGELTLVYPNDEGFYHIYQKK
ncbi:hypothetical protein [Massilibacteroides vaginae]|uniref:hypothetical protein n=1 Tax=Massilibacteroides vaginae TaxID=1673718 RepID=UPI000A1CE44F|nr:hypothetical protein [Massilibacteroides vaginae]